MKLTTLGLIAFSVVAVANAHRHHHEEHEEYEEDRHQYDPVPAIPGNAVPVCTAEDIARGTVTGCMCAPGGQTYTTCNDQKYGLAHCDEVCDDVNFRARACDIFFMGVCKCQQLLIAGNAGTECKTSKPWSGGGDPPTWFLRSVKANVITSPVLNTGLEHLATMPDRDDGWTFGMANINVTTQALTLDSKNSRTRNQIHIHLCKKNTYAAALLSNYTPTTVFTPIPGTPNNWLCKGTNGKKVSTDVVNHLKLQTREFIDRAGVGLLTDIKGRLWHCISEGGTAEHIFCS